MDKKLVSFRFEKEIADFLDEYKKKKGISKVFIVENLLKQFIEGEITLKTKK